MTAIEQKKAIHFDPRTKILLLVFSMIVATTASDLRYECILILFTSIFGFLNGKFRYSLIGAGIYMALYLFTVLYLQNGTGTVHTCSLHGSVLSSRSIRVVCLLELQYPQQK